MDATPNSHIMHTPAHKKKKSHSSVSEMRGRVCVCVSENIKYEGQKCNEWSLIFIVRDHAAGPGGRQRSGVVTSRVESAGVTFRVSGQKRSETYHKKHQLSILLSLVIQYTWVGKLCNLNFNTF